MGRRVSREVAFMHSDASSDSHEIPHARANIRRAWRTSIPTGIDIVLNHVAVSVDVASVDRRAVVQILLNDAELAHVSSIAFPPGGNGRDSDQLPSLEIAHSLLAQIDDDLRAALNRVPMPVR